LMNGVMPPRYDSVFGLMNGVIRPPCREYQPGGSFPVLYGASGFSVAFSRPDGPDSLAAPFDSIEGLMIGPPRPGFNVAQLPGSFVDACTLPRGCVSLAPPFDSIEGLMIGGLKPGWGRGRGIAASLGPVPQPGDTPVVSRVDSAGPDSLAPLDSIKGLTIDGLKPGRGRGLAAGSYGLYPLSVIPVDARAADCMPPDSEAPGTPSLPRHVPNVLSLLIANLHLN